MLALLRCGCWLALVSVAKSWSVTIDSADDLVCKGGAGFSKYVRSPLGWLAVLPAMVCRCPRRRRRRVLGLRCCEHT
jgi:hypothetical protein